MEAFAQFVPLLVIGVIFMLVMRYGWRVKWGIALLGFIPVVNFIVIYFVGKLVHSRIDELEHRLSDIENNSSAFKQTN